MTDYASLKVPDLKKLLSERSLPQSGNKADLIARLQEHDKSQAEDVIDWDDDDTKDAAVMTKKDDPKPAADAAPPATAQETPASTEPAAAQTQAEPAAEAAAPAAVDAPAQDDATSTAAPVETATGVAAETDKKAESSSFALGLSATEAEAEQKKRDDRAKRFGITVEDDTDDAKKAERAKRFGTDTTVVPKGLDEALPERRPKRGRDHADDGNHGGKRQNFDNRNGRGRHNNRSRGARRAGGGGGGGGRNQTRSGGRVFDDPTEKKKAEARAKRFGGDN